MLRAQRDLGQPLTGTALIVVTHRLDHRCIILAAEVRASSTSAVFGTSDQPRRDLHGGFALSIDSHPGIDQGAYAIKSSLL